MGHLPSPIEPTNRRTCVAVDLLEDIGLKLDYAYVRRNNFKFLNILHLASSEYRDKREQVIPLNPLRLMNIEEIPVVRSETKKSAAAEGRQSELPQAEFRADTPESLQSSNSKETTVAVSDGGEQVTKVTVECVEMDNDHPELSEWTIVQQHSVPPQIQ